MSLACLAQEEMAVWLVGGFGALCLMLCLSGLQAAACVLH